MQISDESRRLSDIWRGEYTRFADHILAMIPDSEYFTLLELGCGRGQLTLPLASNIKGRIIGVDSSGENIELLKKELIKKGLEKKANLIASRAEDLILPEKSIDVVLSNFFFGWLDQGKARDIIKSCYKFLKRGGLMIHSDLLPRGENPAQHLAVEQGFKENNLNPSVRWWSPEEIGELVELEGLEVSGVSYFDWGIKLDYKDAVVQLDRWGACPDYIKKKGIDLKKYGLELPQGFIVRAVKKGG